VSRDHQEQTGDEPDYTVLAASAEEKAKSAKSLHQAALWRELAETYRELAAYPRRNEGIPSDHAVAEGPATRAQPPLHDPPDGRGSAGGCDQDGERKARDGA
jgi:hypothetical protein